MTIHLFTPPTQAARDRVTALELEQLDRAVEDARREDTLRQIREAVRPGILRAQRRQAWRRRLAGLLRLFDRPALWEREEYEQLFSVRERLFFAGLAALCLALIAAVMRYADQIDGWAR